MESNANALYVVVTFIVVSQIVFWMPFFYCGYLVIKRGEGVKGRWLFAIVCPTIALTLLVGIPVLFLSIFSILANFVVPLFKQALQHLPWWIPIAEGIARYWWMAYFPVVLVYCVGTIIFANALWQRWPGLFDALVSKPCSVAKPQSNDLGDADHTQV